VRQRSPVCRAWVSRKPPASQLGRRIRYVSQAIWPERPAAETVEAVRHEALVNLAFAQADAAIMCLYDTDELGQHMAAAAEQTHPTVIRDGQVRPSSRYAGQGQIPPVYDRPLAPPPPHARSLSYRHDLRPVRARVAECAQQAGLTDDRAADLMLGASEVAANTLRHTAGGGTLWVWSGPGEVVCQVQDSGNVADPLAGRWRPVGRPSGQGLWVVNQVCDLVEFRTGPGGTIVRMHMCRWRTSGAGRHRPSAGSAALPIPWPHEAGNASWLAVSSSRSRPRPRCSRDITVPTGQFMIWAISR
jgi:anti-sigma regulatory factor (Ser/Thr protein kinase)